MLEAAPRGLPLPWWAKIGAKIVLSRVLAELPHAQALGLFLHGNLIEVAQHHAARTCWRSTSASRRRATSLLDFGREQPGTALYAAAEGVERMWLADVGDFASDDMAFYRRLAGMVRGVSGSPAHADFTDRAGMLASINADLSDRRHGEPRRAFPMARSISILSTAVLEHVGRADFAPARARDAARCCAPAARPITRST